MNIGIRPTMDNGTKISLEVNILDFDADIYNESLEIEFIRKIRDEIKFNSIDELIQQLQKDRQEVSDSI